MKELREATWEDFEETVKNYREHRRSMWPDSGTPPMLATRTIDPMTFAPKITFRSADGMQYAELYFSEHVRLDWKDLPISS